MAKKYNNKLLTILNSVRAGESKPFVIGYTISKSLMEKDSIANPKATATEIEQEIVNALEVWKAIFSAIYSPNRKIKGSLQINYKNSNDDSNDINISIKKSKSNIPVEVKGSTIFLSSEFNWKALKYNIGLDIFSHVVYGIGKIFHISDSYNNNSMMSRIHLSTNYAPFYMLSVKNGKVLNPIELLDGEVGKNIANLYGSMNYAYSIIYGCTDINASNFNPKATRSANVCKYRRKRSINSTNSTNSTNSY